FEIGNLGLVARLDERLEAAHDELGQAAAKHGLLAEEVRLRLLGERGRQDAAARSADTVRVGEGPRLRAARRILADRHEARHAAALFVLATDEMAGPL